MDLLAAKPADRASFTPIEGNDPIFIFRVRPWARYWTIHVLRSDTPETFR